MQSLLYPASCVCMSVFVSAFVCTVEKLHRQNVTEYLLCDAVERFDSMKDTLSSCLATSEYMFDFSFATEMSSTPLERERERDAFTHFAKSQRKRTRQLPDKLRERDRHSRGRRMRRRKRKAREFFFIFLEVFI